MPASGQKGQEGVRIGSGEGLLLAGDEVFDVDGPRGDFVRTVDGDEGDVLPGGIVELLLELAGVGPDLDGDAAFPQRPGERKDVAEFLRAHDREEQPGAGGEVGGEFAEPFEDVVDAVGAEGNADAGQVREAEYAGEIVITTAATDTSDREIESLDLEDGTGVIVEAAGEGEVDLDPLGNARRRDETEELLEFVEAFEAGLGYDAGAEPPFMSPRMVESFSSVEPERRRIGRSTATASALSPLSIISSSTFSKPILSSLSMATVISTTRSGNPQISAKPVRTLRLLTLMSTRTSSRENTRSTIWTSSSSLTWDREPTTSTSHW